MLFWFVVLFAAAAADQLLEGAVDLLFEGAARLLLPWKTGLP